MAYGGNAQGISMSYPFSKLCMMLFAYELDRKLTDAGKHIAVIRLTRLMVETDWQSHVSHRRLWQIADILGLPGFSNDGYEFVCDDKFAEGPVKYFDRATINRLFIRCLMISRSARTLGLSMKAWVGK